MTLFQALRILALKEVLRHTEAYQIRQIYRWYAKTYCITPLAAQELPLEHVLEEYFEYQYGQLEPDKLEEERQRLVETEEERDRRLLDEEKAKVSEDDFAAMTKQMAEAAKAKPLDTVKVAEKKPIKGEGAMKEVSLDTGNRLKKGDKLPEAVTIHFADDSDFQKLLEEDDASNLKK